MSDMNVKDVRNGLTAESAQLGESLGAANAAEKTVGDASDKTIRGANSAADGFEITKMSAKEAASQATDIPESGERTAWDPDTLSRTEQLMWVEGKWSNETVSDADGQAKQLVGLRNDAELGRMAQSKAGRTVLDNAWQAMDEGWTTGSEYGQMNRVCTAMATTRTNEAQKWLDRAHGDEGRAAVIGTMVRLNQDMGNQLLTRSIEDGDSRLVANVFSSNSRALERLEDTALVKVSNMWLGDNASNGEKAAIDKANHRAEAILVDRANALLAGKGSFDIAAVAREDRALAVRILDGADPSKGAKQYGALLGAYPDAVKRLSTDKLLQIADSVDSGAVVSELTERYGAELREPGKTGFEKLAADHPVAMRKMLSQDGFRQAVMKDAGRWGEGEDRRDFFQGVEALLGPKTRDLSPIEKGELGGKIHADIGLLGSRTYDEIRPFADSLESAVSLGKRAEAAHSEGKPAAAIAQPEREQPAADAAKPERAAVDPRVASAVGEVAALGAGHTIEVENEGGQPKNATLTLGAHSETVQLEGEDFAPTMVNAAAKLTEAAGKTAQAAAAEQARTQRSERWNRIVRANVAGLESIGAENVPQGGAELANRIATVGDRMMAAGFEILGPAEGDTAKAWGRRMTAAAVAAKSALGEAEPGEVERFLAYVAAHRTADGVPTDAELSALAGGFRSGTIEEQPKEAVTPQREESAVVQPAPMDVDIPTLRKAQGDLSTPQGRRQVTSFVARADQKTLDAMAQNPEGRAYLAEAQRHMLNGPIRDRVLQAIALNRAPKGATLPEGVEDSPAAWALRMYSPSGVMKTMLQSDNPALQAAGREVLASRAERGSELTDAAVMEVLAGLDDAALATMASSPENRAFLADMRKSLDNGVTTSEQYAQMDRIATALALGQPASEAAQWVGRIGYRFMAPDVVAAPGKVVARLLAGSRQQVRAGNEIMRELIGYNKTAVRAAVKADDRIYARLDNDILAAIGRLFFRNSHAHRNDSAIGKAARQALAQRTESAGETSPVGAAAGYASLYAGAEAAFRTQGSAQMNQRVTAFAEQLDASEVEGMDYPLARALVYAQLLEARQQTKRSTQLPDEMLGDIADRIAGALKPAD